MLLWQLLGVYLAWDVVLFAICVFNLDFVVYSGFVFVIGITVVWGVCCLFSGVGFWFRFAVRCVVDFVVLTYMNSFCFSELCCIVVVIVFCLCDFGGLVSLVIVAWLLVLVIWGWYLVARLRCGVCSLRIVLFAFVVYLLRLFVVSIGFGFGFVVCFCVCLCWLVCFVCLRVCLLGCSGVVKFLLVLGLCVVVY